MRAIANLIVAAIAARDEPADARPAGRGGPRDRRPLPGAGAARGVMVRFAMRLIAGLPQLLPAFIAAFVAAALITLRPDPGRSRGRPPLRDRRRAESPPGQHPADRPGRRGGGRDRLPGRRPRPDPAGRQPASLDRGFTAAGLDRPGRDGCAPGRRAAVAVVIGLLDDVLNLRARWQLLSQLAAGGRRGPARDHDRLDRQPVRAGPDPRWTARGAWPSRSSGSWA